MRRAALISVESQAGICGKWESAIDYAPGRSQTSRSFEAFTRSQLRQASVAVTGEGDGPKESIPALITIPVVVHIVYNSSSQNISDAQVQSQIDVLNADYQKKEKEKRILWTW